MGLLTADGSRSRHFRCQESCTRRMRVNATHATPPKTTTTTSNSGRCPPTKPIECLQYPRSSPDVRRLGGGLREGNATPDAADIRPGRPGFTVVARPRPTEADPTRRAREGDVLTIDEVV